MIAAMQFAALLLLIHKMLTICNKNCKIDKVFLMFLIVNSLLFFGLYLLHFKFDFGSHLALVLLFALLSLFQYQKGSPGGLCTAGLDGCVFLGVCSVFYFLLFKTADRGKYECYGG